MSDDRERLRTAPRVGVEVVIARLASARFLVDASPSRQEAYEYVVNCGDAERILREAWGK